MGEEKEVESLDDIIIKVDVPEQELPEITELKEKLADKEIEELDKEMSAWQIRALESEKQLEAKDKTISGMTAVIMGHESTIINLERSLKRSAKQCEDYGVRIQELEADLKKESKDPPKDDEDKGG